MMMSPVRRIPDPSPNVLGLEMSVTLLARTWQARLTERLGEVGLTTAQWRVLRTLAAHPEGLGQRELASLIGVEEPGVVRLVDTLQSAGLVSRRVADHDRRSRIVAVTEAARPVVDQAHEIAGALCREVTGAMPAGDVEQCVRTLRRLLAKLQSLPRLD